MNPAIQKIAGKLKCYQIKIEVILIIIALIGIALKDSETGRMLIIISLGILLILNFFMAFVSENPDNLFLTFIQKVIYLSFSVGIIGILFTINHYPFAELNLKIGLISMIFGFVGLLIIKIRNKGEMKNINSNLIRTFVMIITTAGLMFFGNLSDINPNTPEKSAENHELIEK